MRRSLRFLPNQATVRFYDIVPWHAAERKERQDPILFEIQPLPGRAASQATLKDPKKDYIQSDYRSCSFLGYYYFAKIRKNHKALHFVLPNILHFNCPHLYFFKHFSFRNNSQEEIFVFLLIRELFLLCTIQLFLCLWITFGYVLTNFGLREAVLLF